MTRRKILILLGSVCLALVMVVPIVASCAGPAAPSPSPTPTPTPTPMPTPTEEKYNWRMQAYFSGGSMEIVNVFVDDLETMSGGRIEIQAFGGGELLPTKEILSAVGTGTIEMGLGSGGYWSELDIGNIEQGLPMAWSSTEHTMVFFDETPFRDMLLEAYADHNTRYLGPVFESPYCILSTSPITSIEDMQKLKIRTTSAYGKMFEKVEVSTVYLPGEELYLALATGTIDGVLYSAAAGYVRVLQFNEVAKYYLETSMVNPTTTNAIMNQELWDSLPDDIKAIVESSVIRFCRRFNANRLSGEYAARREGGLTVTSLSSEDIAMLTEAAMVVWDEEAAKSERNAEAIELLKQFNRDLGRIA